MTWITLRTAALGAADTASAEAVSAEAVDRMTTRSRAAGYAMARKGKRGQGLRRSPATTTSSEK